MIFNSQNSQQKNLQYPKALPVTTPLTISVVERVVTGLFELDLLNDERQFGNFSDLH